MIRWLSIQTNTLTCCCLSSPSPCLPSRGRCRGRSLCPSAGRSLTRGRGGGSHGCWCQTRCPRGTCHTSHVTRGTWHVARHTDLSSSSQRSCVCLELSSGMVKFFCQWCVQYSSPGGGWPDLHTSRVTRDTWHVTPWYWPAGVGLLTDAHAVDQGDE